MKMKKIRLVLILVLLTFFASTANADLVGFWRLNENSGLTANDSSSYGNNGNVSSVGVTWMPGKYNAGLGFVGNPDGRVVIHDSSSLHFTNSFTIMAWVKPNTTTPFKDVLSKYTPGDPVTFSLKQDAYNRGIWEIDTSIGGGYYNVWSNALIQVDVWQHVAVTYNGVVLQFYINGVPDNSEPITGNVYSDSDPVIIGGQNGSGSNAFPYDGTIDEVRIYNNALTQEQIVADMNKASIGQPPVAVAGPDVDVPANTIVTLDGSVSSDPDGTIENYQWTRLPDNVFVCSKVTSTCDIKSLGWAQEVIQLVVMDNDGNQSVPSLMSIFFKAPPRCGNSVIETGETCDSDTQPCIATGGYAGHKTCNSQCSGYLACETSQFCGDNIVNGNEVCDNNSRVCTTINSYAGSQSCNAQCDGFNTCTSTLFCGDGICTNPPESFVTCPQDCTPPPFTITLEAENMPTKTTGGSITGGWNIWANGYIQGPVQFPKTGVYKFDIVAKGSVASGVWPNMELRIDQSTKASFTVNSTNWSTYTASVNVPQGSHNVAIAFTNDLYNPPTEDRNLYVDKVMITGQ